MATPPTILLVGDPHERISFTIGGRTSLASRQGFALLWEFERRAKNRWPGCRFRIIQPANNTGVPASAGTHDKDDVWDWELIDAGTWAQESELARDTGLWDWVRDPTQGDFGWHHHAIAPGLPLDRYGSLVPAQMDDYRRHALGLKGQHDSGSDPQCFTLGRLTHTVKRFDYQAWKDDHMPLSEEDVNRVADKVLAKLMDAQLTLSDGTTVPVSQAYRRAAQMPGNLDTAVAAINEQTKASAKNTNTKVANSRAAIMAALDSLDAQVGP
jgi:hypothetical protein